MQHLHDSDVTEWRRGSNSNHITVKCINSFISSIDRHAKGCERSRTAHTTSMMKFFRGSIDASLFTWSMRSDQSPQTLSSSAQRGTTELHGRSVIAAGELRPGRAYLIFDLLLRARFHLFPSPVEVHCISLINQSTTYNISHHVYQGL